MSMGCILCLKKFWPSLEICSPPCGHVYHYDCVSQWVKSYPNCPLCRRPLEKCDLIRLHLAQVTDDVEMPENVMTAELIHNLTLQLHKSNYKRKKLWEQCWRIKADGNLWRQLSLGWEKAADSIDWVVIDRDDSPPLKKVRKCRK